MSEARSAETNPSSPDPEENLRPGWRVYAAAVILLLLGTAAYWRTFSVPFLYDDIPSIVENPSIRQLWPLSVPLSPPSQLGYTVSGRPLVNLSLAINYAISGKEVWSYHVFNLGVHLLAGLALFGLVRRTLGRPVIDGKLKEFALPAAFLTALLWILHPLQTEAVTYVVQRAESLMGLFFLCTFYCFARSMDSRRASYWQGTAAVACLLGMGCKEVMATVPVLVFLYDRTFWAGSFRQAWRARRWFYAALTATWLPLAWLVLGTGGNRGGTFVFTPVAFWEYGLTQFEAVTRYLQLVFLPVTLVFDYGLFKVEYLSSVLPFAILIFVLLVSTLWALRRRPIAGFLGAAFFITLSPTSLVPGLMQVIVEHRMYLPLAAVLALVVCAVVGKFGRRGLLACGTVGLVMGGLTLQRNEVYRSSVSLWADTLSKRPVNPTAMANLGVALDEQGKIEEALPYYVAALKIEPGSGHNHYNLGVIYYKLKRMEEARSELSEAVRLLPGFASAYSMLAATLVELGRLDEALEAVKAALSQVPDLPDGNQTLGTILLRRGMLPEAEAAFRRALGALPDFAQAEGNLGIVLQQMGRLPEALQHLGRAVQLKPERPEMHFDLAVGLVAAGRVGEAEAQYRKTLELAPAHAEAKLNLGILLAQQGKLPEALGLLEDAAKLNPNSEKAQLNLGIVLAQLGRIPEAIGHYENALRLVPAYPFAHYNLGNALLQQQRWAEARAHFEETLRLAPNFQAAREMLERLRDAP